MTHGQDIDAEFRTAFELTDRNIASIDDVTSLHNVVSDEYTGDGVTVVVMDSGIDTDHPVFDDVTIADQVDMTGSGTGDDIGHGTACASLIARLAPDVELISLRIFGSSGSTGMSTIMDAYDWLLDNSDRVDVVNMSWGATRKVQPIDDKHNQLVEAGVKPVVAAGNTGEKGGSPSTADRAFSVGAVDEHGSLTNFSSYNPNHDNPDVCAIGKNNRLARADGTSMGAVIDDYWTKASGTSFSAPILSGFVAQLCQEHRNVDIESAFESTADNIPQTKEDGAGIANYKRTLNRSIEDDPETDKKPRADATAWNFAGHDEVYIDEEWLPESDLVAVKVESDPVTIEFRRPT